MIRNDYCSFQYNIIYFVYLSYRYGEDYTRATLQCTGKGGVYIDSLQPDSLARIRELESYTEQPIPQTPAVMEAPKFVTQLSDITQLKEGQSAHFEARLTPVNDANLTVSHVLLIVEITLHRVY